MTLTANEIAAIQAIETFSSVLSIGGCTMVLSRLFMKKERVWNITNKQIVVLCTIDLITAIFWGIGHAGAGDEGFCQFQAFMIQWGALANICWNSSMALHLYHWIALKKAESKLKKKIKKTAIASIGIPFLLSVILLASGVYGPTSMWCWVDNDYEWARFVFFYLILLVAWLYNTYILKSVSDAVSSRVTTKEGGSGKKGLFSAEAGIQMKLRQYISVFVLAWFFGLFNRFVEAVAGEPVFTTTLLHAFFVPLQGFMNACCYGGLLSQLSAVAQTVTTAVRDETGRKRNTSTDGGPNLAAVTYTPKKVSIFVSSFNQGEATLDEMAADIPGWMLEGHDMYVIGLQECMCLEEFRAAMHMHLGQEEWTIHTCEIGSNNTRLGFHGFIALTVFVRTEDLQKGFIKMTESSANDLASGTDLIVTTAANKGAVGLPFQIHDTSIGFVTAHLPSDSKVSPKCLFRLSCCINIIVSQGKSKLPKRNGAARSMLREVVLASEDVGCDMHLLHDHLVVLGDLNYRMNPPVVQNKLLAAAVGSVSALSTIANASLAEMRALDNDPNWYRRKYDLFYGPRSPKFMSPEERVKMLEAVERAAGEWDKVLACDEMIEMMNLGEVFFGFKEVPPRFPPTYKRKKGAAGDCGDYSTVADLISGYSHTGEEGKEGELDDSRHSTDSSFSENTDMDTSTNSAVAAPAPAATAESSAIDVEQGLPAESSPQQGEEKLDSSDGALSAAALRNAAAIDAKKAAAKPNRRGSMFSMRRGSILAMTPEKEEEKKRSKLRPPSYTDRVIVHSLVEDHKLMPTAYGFCDSVRGSDHRPVCMAMTLEVNSTILPTRVMASESTSTMSSEDLTSPYVILMSLSIENLDCMLTEKNAVVNPMLADAPASSGIGAGQKSLIMNSISEDRDDDEGDEENQRPSVDEGDVRESTAERPSSLARMPSKSRLSTRQLNTGTVPVVSEVLITFPLPGKDPLLEHRKMYDFAKAFNVGGDSSHGFFK
jgi:hypothetical protein